MENFTRLLNENSGVLAFIAIIVAIIFGVISIIFGISTIFIPLYFQEKKSVVKNFSDEGARNKHIDNLRTFLEANSVKKYKNSYFSGLQSLLEQLSHFFGGIFSAKSLNQSIRIALIYPHSSQYNFLAHNKKKHQWYFRVFARYIRPKPAHVYNYLRIIYFCNTLVYTSLI